jgi:hypothetical protein
LNESKLWKQIIDIKYSVDNPKKISCSSFGASPFGKGVMWLDKAAKMGYQWKVGDGKKDKFWEIIGLGPPALLLNIGKSISWLMSRINH